MPRSIFVYFLFTLLIFTSCSSSKVVSTYDHNVDFSGYHNYMTLGRFDTDKLNEEGKRHVKAIIDSELQQRGLSSNLSPDLLIKVRVVSEDKEAAAVTRNNDFYWGSDTYQYGWGIGTGVNNVKYNTYTEGTLIIDVIDRNDKKLVWQGVANDAFKGTKENNAKYLETIIKQMFITFPISK